MVDHIKYFGIIAMEIEMTGCIQQNIDNWYFNDDDDWNECPIAKGKQVKPYLHSDGDDQDDDKDGGNDSTKNAHLQFFIIVIITVIIMIFFI